MNAWSSPVAWGICVLTLAVVAATSVLVLINLPTIGDINEANLIEIVISICVALLGAMVASRQPENALGWICLAIGFFNAVPGAAGQYTRFALLTQPGAPFTAWIPWVGELSGIIIYPAGLVALAFLLTPDGHFLSPRWRWVAWVGAVLTALLGILIMTDTRLGEAPVPNPTAVPAISELLAGPTGDLAFLGGLGVLAVAGSSVVVRLRRARGEERLQLRWIAMTAAFTVAINVVTVVASILLPMPEEVATVVTTLATVIGFGVVLPAGFAVAMLRYRLYDLDLLLNRTALYSSVSVVLIGAFVAANVVAQRAIESLFTNDRSW